MSETIIILIFFILIGCGENNQKPVSLKKGDELAPETKKSRNNNFAQKPNDNLKTDSVYKEYLGVRLKPIRENFKRINEIKAWTSVDKRKLNESAKGGAVTYYFLKDTLLKIVDIHFGETGKIINEFYTKNERLSFVLEQEYQYNRPVTRDSIAMKKNNDAEVFDIDKSEIIVDSSYFENGILIRQINNEDCGSPFAKDYLKEEQVRLMTEFEKLKERLRK